ncbi:MAG: NAD(P)-dependent alcohol dehydrogenase [Bdellovibrionales bacterium]
MTINVHGYAAKAPKAALVPFDFERRDERPDDVSIEILYCGVCHSDIHHVNADWKTAYPVVPGHEIIGRVTSVGKKVKRFKKGDHVGVGCMVDSCQQCEPCQHGLEQYCEEGATMTYNGIDRHDHMPTYGGYSTKIIVNEKFVLKIPKGMDLKSAAPLLCAGITTWSPLRHWKVKKGTKVGVIGLGGLGHMAIKLAHAMGAHVTLFSRSPGKEKDARCLGAHQIVISTDPEQMDAVRNTFDLIIDTVPYAHDINSYAQTLTLSGTLVLVGYLGNMEPTIDSTALVLKRIAVAGSVIGGIKETQEMLDFCGKHGITSDVEVIKMHEINDAYRRMLKSDVKYRFVIDMASLKK